MLKIAPDKLHPKSGRTLRSTYTIPSAMVLRFSARSWKLRTAFERLNQKSLKRTYGVLLASLAIYSITFVKPSQLSTTTQTCLTFRFAPSSIASTAILLQRTIFA
jgi:hypothetical protein